MVLEKLFGWGRNKEKDPPIQFGRYSDNNKSVEKVQRWTHADILYKEKKYLQSVSAFLDYLRDDEQENVVVHHENGGLSFTVYQGSKIVRGIANNEYVKAEIALAKMTGSSIPVMRKLLEMNFNLYYSRHAKKDDVIYVRFDTPLSGATPNKMYYGLKELATKGDKQDDLLIGEFKQLEPVDIAHIEQIPETEKQVKFEHMQTWVKSTLDFIDTLDAEKFSGGISYLLLTLVFRIDYLITPEGKILSELEKIATIYYTKDDKTHPERNPMMIEGFRKLLSKPKEEIFSQLFRSKYTFAIVVPHNLKSISESIQTSLENMIWYRDNNYPDLANKVMEYGFAYCQYSYSLPKPLTDLFRMFMQINYSEYFRALGFANKYYNEEENDFDEALIKSQIETIVNYWKHKYSLLNFNTRKLKFDTLLNFNQSFLQEIATLNFE